MNHCFSSLLFLMVFTVVLAEEFGSAIDQDSEESASGESPEYDANNTQTAKADLTEESRGPIGEGFNVHKMHLLTNQLQATGAEIFDNLPYDECLRTAEFGSINKETGFISSTESLYTLISTLSTRIPNVDLKGEYILGASVSAVTNDIVSGNTDVSGMLLSFKALALKPALKERCIDNQPLAKELVKDFEALETNIENPWLKESWERYEGFLEKYGSHIVDGVFSGSSVIQYVFAKSTEQYSQKEFLIKACLSLGGPTQIGEVGVSACSGVSKEDVQSAASLEMVEKLVVRGATAESRADMTGELTKENIHKFLQEGFTNPSPISYTFYPIWKVLKTRYIGTASFVKAVNLEQYYKGYLSFGCPYEETTNGIPIQKFELGAGSQPEDPIYVCNLAPDGCHVDDDCYYRSGLICNCRGDSCIRYKEETLNSGQTKKVVYANKEEGYRGEGCRFKSLKCYCTDPRTEWAVSWSGETAITS